MLRDKKDRFCEVLRDGGSHETAAALIGMTLPDVRRQTKRDAKFLTAIRQAEAEFEWKILKIVNHATKEQKNWRACTWLLEHRFPDRYGRRKANTLTAAEVANLMAQLADIVTDAVPIPEHRCRILARVGDLVRSLGFQPHCDENAHDEHAYDEQDRDAEQLEPEKLIEYRAPDDPAQ